MNPEHRSDAELRISYGRNEGSVQDIVRMMQASLDLRAMTASAG